MPPRSPLLSWLAGAALCGLLAGLGLLLEPGSFLAFEGGELWGHAWVQWWHGEALPDWPGGTDRAAGADLWPVIDPLTTLLAAVAGRVVGVVAAWNLVLLLAIGGAFVGGAWLARREEGAPWVGGLGLALAPCFLGSLQSGLTEDAGIGLAAVGLGLVGRPSWKEGLLAGLCLGLLASTGLVLAWQAAVVAVGLGLWGMARDRRAIGPTLGGGLLAACLAVPVALLQGSRLQGVGHRSGQALVQAEPLWRLNPWRGVDLASFLAPWPQDPGDALVRIHPGYLGLSMLVLALFAGRSRWWFVLVGAVLVAPGDVLSWVGEPLGVQNPFAAVVDLLPGGGLINHHGRLLLVGAVALSVLAARGAARLGRRALPVAGVAVLLDLVLLAPGGAPLPTANSTVPDIMAHLDELPEGAVLVVPAAGPGIHFQRPLYWQTVHRRSSVLDPNGPGIPGSVGRTELGRWLGTLALPGPKPPPPADLSVPGGLVIVALAPWDEQVEAVLGEADVVGEEGRAWWWGP